jgi:hypothetical protein
MQSLSPGCGWFRGAPALRVHPAEVLDLSEEIVACVLLEDTGVGVLRHCGVPLPNSGQ